MEVVVEVAADVLLPNADLPPANTELVVPATPKTEPVEATFGHILFEIVESFAGFSSDGSMGTILRRLERTG